MPTSSSYQMIARAVSAYADQKRTDAVKLIGTDLVGSDVRINVDAEDYYGSIRWNKTLGDLAYTGVDTSKTNINIATENETEGEKSDFMTDVSEFIKTSRNFGVGQYNITQLLTKQPGAIFTVGQQMADIRARDEDAALRAVIEGVVAAEVKVGEANTNQGGQTATKSLADDRGFYVDLGSTKLVNTSKTGAKAVEGLLDAIEYAFADLEPEYMYAIIDPATMTDLRISNFVDDTKVTEGNVSFSTILEGKIRLIVSRKGFAAQSTSSAVTGTKTTVLMLPGAVSFTGIAQPVPVEFDRDASKGTGSGETEMWSRWGYVLAPYGYTWAGSKDLFATNATFQAAASWTRKESVGNLGILPIFHS